MKRMLLPVTAGLAGLLFGLGLLVGGMTDPARILAFLDLAGRWNPSLAFVMAGALAVTVPGFALVTRRERSLLDAPLQLPKATRIDRRLVLGSLAFGVGWGLAGFCPGPALVATGAGSSGAFVFLLAMLAGMALFELLERRAARKGRAS